VAPLWTVLARGPRKGPEALGGGQGGAGSRGCNCTIVAPQPPRSGGASVWATTKGWRARSVRTEARWTPVPRPWINRTSRKPCPWAACRYSSTTERTSAGAKACRSSASSMGIRIGSSALIGLGVERRLQGRSGHHVLLPVLEAQEILPRELALSEGGGALEEPHIDDPHAFRARRLGYLLGYHLAHKGDGDPSEPMQHLVGAADPRAR
jgi:hypothetical protein